MDNGYSAATPIGTGVAGLDLVLHGGLTPERLYLLQGVPGSGKTTMALQFLMDGAARGEKVLFLALSETAQELHESAASHGWSLDGIEIHELAPMGDPMDATQQYTMFNPSEVELGEATQRILEAIERVRPQRVAIDSLAEIRLLAGSTLRFRRQVLALKHFFNGRGITVLLLDEGPSNEAELHVHTIVHGAIVLEHMRTEYGGDRRRLRVTKFRGRRYVGGFHDYVIETGGVRVFPRLVAAQHRRDGTNEPMPSGLPSLDALLGGGLDRGTSTLLVGAAGTGKSSLAGHFVVNAAARGERAVRFLFDESIRTMLTRARGLGSTLERYIADGGVTVQSVDPAELSPGEFIQSIRDAVEREDARIVVIDSLNGYMNAMAGESSVLIQLHELLSYLGQLGVVTLLINAQQGLIGHMHSTIDVSYLADTVVLLRYFEARGAVRQAIAVLKKRTGRHERTIRELRISDQGIDIGEPLSGLRGVLTGVPHEERTAPPDDAPR